MKKHVQRLCKTSTSIFIAILWKHCYCFVQYSKKLSSLILRKSYKLLQEMFNHQKFFLPIKDAEIPVGPNKRHFGLSGLSPGALKILSLHWAVKNMRRLFPVPPGPKMNHKINFILPNNTQNFTISISINLPVTMISGGSSSTSNFFREVKTVLQK